MTTATEKKKDYALAIDTLDRYAAEIQNGNGLILISQELGKGLTDYYRVSLVYQTETRGVETAHLTWAIAKALGYSLRDRAGYWCLPVSGYGYSKPDQIARDLAAYYKLDRVKYEIF